MNAEAHVDSKYYIDFFHKTRLVFPYIAAIIAAFWLLFRRKKIKMKLWQVGTLGYCCTALISGVSSGTDYSLLHFHASMICAIIILLFATSIAKDFEHVCEKDLASLLAKTGLVILFLVLMLFFVRDIFQAIYLGTMNGYAIQGMAPNQFGMEAPRSTGNARSAAIIGLSCAIFCLSPKSKQKILFFLSCFTFALLFFYQSRGAFLCLVVSASFVLFMLPRESRPQPKLIAKFAFTSLAIYGTILAAIYFGSVQTGTDSQNILKVLRYTDPENFTSGRIVIWKNGVKEIMESPLIGFGSQADRVRLDKNISNLALYSLICSGLFGFAFGALVIITTLKNIFALSVVRRYRACTKVKVHFFLALGIFLFLLTRGAVENSFALFNIDFLLALPAIWYLNLDPNLAAVIKVNHNNSC